MADPRYIDLDLTFIPNKETGDIQVLTDEDAVKRSLRNLFLTNFGEYPFIPNFGSQINSLLFEPVSPLLAIVLQRELRNVITVYEPRADILDLQIKVSPDQNKYDVLLSFTVLNNNTPVIIKTYLRQIR